MFLVLIQALLFATLLKINNAIQERPVIAVLAQYNTKRSEQYIAASYVKWLESMGARTIPVLHDADDTTIDAIFQQVNGVLLPGGSDQDITDGIRRLWHLAVDANSNGDRFPVFGTCLGFEYMVSLASLGGETLLESNYDAENISLPLNLTKESINNSKLFSNLHIRQIASTQNVTMNNHRQGIPSKSFLSDPLLSSMFNIISTNVDRNGKEFVSTIESKNNDYPFYGVQWHPEKNNFENSVIPNTNIPYENINHTPDAIDVSLEMVRVFVNEARKNKHVYNNFVDFPLIWEYELVNGIVFEQRFVIKRYNHARSFNLRNGVK